MTPQQLRILLIELRALLNAIEATTLVSRQTIAFREIRLLAQKAERGTR